MNLKQGITLALYSLTSAYCNAQPIVIRGLIMDTLTREPLAFVSIGLVTRTVGTIQMKMEVSNLHFQTFMFFKSCS